MGLNNVRLGPLAHDAPLGGVPNALSVHAPCARQGRRGRRRSVFACPMAGKISEQQRQPTLRRPVAEKAEEPGAADIGSRMSGIGG
jgi:hypothetical protein